MLSGVASDSQVHQLADNFSHAELVRMLNLIQQTAAGFTRSSSRRLDAELCILNLCQPELSLDEEALNARLNRLEEQIQSGQITVKSTPVSQPKAEEQPTVTQPAPPAAEGKISLSADEAPLGFWSDIAAEVRKELRPPVSGFFAPTPNAPVQGALVGNQLQLRCTNAFTAQTIGRPDILEIVSRKASSMLGRPIQAMTVDMSAKPAGNARMEQLINFGKSHSDVIKIRNHSRKSNNQKYLHKLTRL